MYDRSTPGFAGANHRRRLRTIQSRGEGLCLQRPSPDQESALMNDRPSPLSIVRHLVSLFVISILLGLSPAYGQNGSVGVAYPATGINIDGDLSDWPKNATMYPSPASNTATSSPARTTSTPVSGGVQRGRARALCRRRSERRFDRARRAGRRQVGCAGWLRSFRQRGPCRQRIAGRPVCPIREPEPGGRTIGSHRPGGEGGRGADRDQ